ncbi:MAG TPA: bifunctional glycosyltransferase family 2 protein/CDP-glycerol:glycerophosphate glycerophosphotransferase [Streptosporangiaceae bacterium]|nr:bifunctional glycosyltransferase family 2 protein/CDP-glycerol:glycerophosphate glycerophosphotransferase [Streptosporangiaceae bacterium]
MAKPTISVVVPFYNNVDLLGACLTSIAAQTMRDLQVIMVDDGSTDGSAAVAAAQAGADERFTLVRVPNGGPGSARNHGIAAAEGEYLAFVDADDLLPPDAYATLLATLERTGSDFVSGGVLRLTAEGLVPSGLHDQAIRAAKPRTNVSVTRELLYDISVWNKVFRKEFWDRAGLRFPEGMLWEDLIAMTKAHVLANSVDVITEPVYHWRDRDKGAPSITQSRTSIGNFRDRVAALEMIDAFLRERGTPALLRAHQHKALVNDLWLYVRDLSSTSQEYQSEFSDLASSYLKQVDPAVKADQPAARKLAWYLIEQGRQEELIELAGWLAENQARTPPVVRSFGRLQADLPLRRSAQPAIPRRIFRPQWRELDPVVKLDSVTWQGTKLAIEGSAYVPSADTSRRRNTTKLLVLMPRGRRRLPIVIPARSRPSPDLTRASGQDRYNYDWAGFLCEVSPRWFRHPGTWDCFLLVRSRSIWRPTRLHSAAGDVQVPDPALRARGISFGPYWAGRRLQIRAERATALTLNADRQEPGPYFIVLSLVGGWDRHVIEVQAGDGPLTVDVGALDFFGTRAPLRDGRWKITLHRGDPDGPACPVLFGGYENQKLKIGRKIYRTTVSGTSGGAGDLELTAGPALGFAERGRIRRRLLRDLYYRVQLRLPVRESILFLSFDGKACTDNPLGIAEELARRGDGREQVWAIRDWSVPVPHGARPVLIGTAAYYAALGRSRYLIANDHLAQPHRRRAGQRYIQTWHGTPLKRLGYDIVNPSFASGSYYFEFMAADVARWDLLISPNPFSTPILRGAFGYDGEVAETGYPRNDALFSLAPTTPIRQRLGLPEGKKVALYVPTWRENQQHGAGSYRLDFRLDLAEAGRQLAGDYVLLVRGHHLMEGWTRAAGLPGFVFDVTRYPEINDLLRVTDVLITDYSSVMFDFAPAGRPMLFFTYDLEEYRDQLRGFYFDFEAEAPGPLLATSTQVIAALADLDAVAAKYAAAHAEFTAKFCPLDDGKAAARACDRIFR